jgi:glutathione S-transferase
MHTLYNMQTSGNCYKLRLVMAQLDIPFRLHDIDILKGESHTPQFLAINPNGKVPTLVLDGGRPITESGAALWYLADGTGLLPSDPYDRAQALQWMFFEQYSHEPYIAVARFWLSLMPGGREQKRADIDGWLDRGHQALAVMNQHLEHNEFFSGSAYSIADIALYAYTHMAHEGDFDLAPYGAIRAWLDRVSSQPGHIAIDWRPGA